MQPVEYKCDDATHIRRCPPFVSAIGDKAAYWYLFRPLYSWDGEALGMTREQIQSAKSVGLNTVYWANCGWSTHTPKQFETAEEAFTEWESKIKPKNAV